MNSVASEPVPCRTLYARYAPGSIGYIIMQDIDPVESGAVRELAEIPPIATRHAAQVELCAILGRLPKEVLHFAAAYGWEIAL